MRSGPFWFSCLDIEPKAILTLFVSFIIRMYIRMYVVMNK